ncbi:facilitated trehalose transporter Tret1-like [Periplaneta americana]|uniref:facilitated trehalose transporter Tret1-like n=1 Tax=Periplaneta americana TaxID=6978 RepID=UPI0037E956A8
MEIRQVIASLIASLSLVASGMSLGFPAISLTELKNSDNLTDDESSWFASVVSLSQVVGCLLCGPLLDTFGRRITLMVINTPFIIGYIIMCSLPQPAPLALLFLGRVLTGVASGMVSIPACVYIGEMATDSKRGMLVTWPSIGMSTGILLVYILGLGIKNDWRLVAGITIALPALSSILTFIYLKETSKWLISRGRLSEAEKSFRWIREIGSDVKMPEQLDLEFQQLLANTKRVGQINDEAPSISTISNIMEEKPTMFAAKKESCCSKACSSVASLGSVDTWKPLVIHNFYFFFMQFGGIQVVASYAVEIMESAGVQLDLYIATVLLGTVQLLGGIGASIAFNKCGRRPVSLISGTGMALTMIGLGVYQELNDGSTELSWLPLVLILAYIGLAAIGFNLIPWGLLGELYPTRVAGLAGGLTTCLANVMGFAAIKLYPGFEDSLKGDSERTGGGFFFFGAVACVGTVFVFVFLPETFKKSLKQIGDEFSQPGLGKLRCC